MQPTIAQNIALKVLHALKAAGIDSLCVGGCPRDIAHCKDVGDIDIVVRDSVDPDAVFRALTPVLDDIRGGQYGWGAELFSEYGDDDNLIGDNDSEELNITTDFRERVEWVYKFFAETDGCTVRVDVLAAKNIGPDEDLSKFLQAFDFTINQWALHHNGYVTGTINTGLLVQPLEGLTRCARTTQRYKRLSAKYPDHDWSLVAAYIAGKDAV